MQFPKSTVEQASRIAETHFSGPQRRTVNLYGGVGMGKSTLLASLVEILKDRGELPILVSPSYAEIDTAADAMVQICDGLDSYSLLGDLKDKIKDPNRPFQVKLDLVSARVKDHRDRVVLLCDEPDEWAIRSKQDPLYYVRENSLSRQLSNHVRDGFDCAKVIAERYHLPDQLEHPPVYLKPASVKDSLSDFRSFFPGHAHILNNPPFSKTKQSHFRLRLLSVLIVLGDKDALSEWSDDNALADHFLKFFRFKILNTQLLKFFGRIALVRGEINAVLLDELGFNSATQQHERDLTSFAILNPMGNDSFALHPLMKNAILKAGLLSAQESIKAHAQIARFHKSQLEFLRAQHKEALLLEYRCFDQLAKSGTVSIERVSHFFVSQLHAWGRCLSRDMKLHERAAEVFDLAIKEDPLDDYGHHYKAYNLDYIAKNEQASKHHYRTAVDLNPLHPWYWSRWINFLITTGRMKEAREAWVVAGNALSSPDNCEDEVFCHLHFWVAQLLIHRAQLDFAKQILDEVPDHVRLNQSPFVELTQLLESLFIARDERAVFPTYIKPDEYWSTYPHLHQPLQWKGKSLTAFYSARVEEWHEAHVDLVVGKNEKGDTRYGRLTFTHDEFKKALVGFDWSERDSIRFVELCFYGDDNHLRIDVYPGQSPKLSSLPNLDPPNPNRYLQSWNPRL